ncbi:MAG: hypothetical protein HQK53_08395 [Oligoflexia bacterium]|nr:hypothetical protein [Oligoflexia bacterium]
MIVLNFKTKKFITSFLLILIVLVSLLFKIIFPSIDTDEGFFYDISKNVSEGRFISNTHGNLIGLNKYVSYYQFVPIANFLFMKLFTTPILQIKFLPTMISFATLILLLFVLKRNFEKFIVILFLFSDPIFWKYSSCLRPEVLFSLFSLGYVVILTKIYKSKKISLSFIVLMSVLCALNFLTSFQTVIFMFAVIPLVITNNHYSKSEKITKIIIFGILFLILITPQIYFHYKNFDIVLMQVNANKLHPSIYRIVINPILALIFSIKEGGLLSVIIYTFPLMLLYGLIKKSFRSVQEIGLVVATLIIYILTFIVIGQSNLVGSHRIIYLLPLTLYFLYFFDKENLLSIPKIIPISILLILFLLIPAMAIQNPSLRSFLKGQEIIVLMSIIIILIAIIGLRSKVTTLLSKTRLISEKMIVIERKNAYLLVFLVIVFNITFIINQIYSGNVISIFDYQKLENSFDSGDFSNVRMAIEDNILPFFRNKAAYKMGIAPFSWKLARGGRSFEKLVDESNIDMFLMSSNKIEQTKNDDTVVDFYSFLKDNFFIYKRYNIKNDDSILLLSKIRL